MTAIGYVPSNAQTALAGSALPGVQQFQYMTGATVLEYCEIRMKKLDSEINTHMSTQNNALDRRQALENASSIMGQFGDAGPTTKEQWEQIKLGLEHSVTKLPDGDPVKQQILGEVQTLEGQLVRTMSTATVQITEGAHAEQTGTMTSEVFTPMSNGAWAAARKDLQDTSDQIKGNAELDMLQLQQLVSERQTAIQMATSIMAKMDETTLSIAQKI